MLEEQKMQFACFRAIWRWASLLLSSLLAKLQDSFRAFMVWLILAGPVPTHIAFIMDGNRRFADRLHVDRRIGHSHGYDALLGTLKDCFDLHVKIITLFAFSIDNFRRSPDEVSALMDLMQSKLEVLVEKQGLASEYGIRIQVLGDLHLLPDGARMAAEKAMAVTRHNSSLVLNLCVSYTSTQEIVQSIQQTCDNFLATWGESGLLSRDNTKSYLAPMIDVTYSMGLGNHHQMNNVKRAKSASKKNEFILRDVYEVDFDNKAHEVVDPCTDHESVPLQCSSNRTVLTNCWYHPHEFHSCEERAKMSACNLDKHCYSKDRIFKAIKDYVSEEKIEKNLYTYPCPPPDLLIRTSGETRLSNFLMWQTTFSHLAFCKVLWPEFSFRHLFCIILEYQRAFPSLLKKRQYYNPKSRRYH